MLRMPDLQNLIPFIQVVQCGSFSAAAEQLGVTPPAVSKSVAKLEGQLGVRLINRTTRQLHLTSEGRDFFEKVNQLIDGIDNAIENAKSSTQEPHGLVRIAVEAIFGRYCLMPALAEFFRQYPDVQLEVDFDDNPKGLLEKGFDVEIRHGQGSQTSYVSRRLLFDFPIILVASPTYLAERGIPRTIADLAQHECISASEFGVASDWKLTQVSGLKKGARKIGKEDFTSIPKGRLTVGAQYDTGLIAGLHGIGIASTPLQAALPFLETGQLKVVLPDCRIVNTSSLANQIFIRYPHREYLPPKVRVFIHYLLEKFHSESDPNITIHTYSA